MAEEKSGGLRPVRSEESARLLLRAADGPGPAVTVAGHLPLERLVTSLRVGCTIP